MLEEILEEEMTEQLHARHRDAPRPGGGERNGPTDGAYQGPSETCHAERHMEGRCRAEHVLFRRPGSALTPGPLAGLGGAPGRMFLAQPSDKPMKLPVAFGTRSLSATRYMATVATL